MFIVKNEFKMFNIILAEILGKNVYVYIYSICTQKRQKKLSDID